MNTIIVYSSKYGCTEDCAKSLKSGLPGFVSLTDIDKINPKDVRIENFDTVILGSSIYVGSISKKMRVFCKEMMDVLCRKKVGIFLCCALPAEMNTYLSTNFPAQLLKNAVVIKDFGGDARVDKMKTLDKMIIKAATKGGYKNLKISRENIEGFIREISTVITSGQVDPK